MCERRKEIFGGKKKWLGSIFTFMASMFIVLGILTCSGKTVNAEENLPVGSVFYDKYFKYRVTREYGVEYSWENISRRNREECYGRVQVVGFNPEEKGFVGSIGIQKEVYAPGTSQKFIIDSIGKNAFANTKIRGVDIDSFVALFAPDTHKVDMNLLNGCFKNCKDLEYVVFHNSARGGCITVNKNAFKGCKNLKFIGVSSLHTKEEVNRCFNFKKGAFSGIKDVTVVSSAYMRLSYTYLDNGEASEVYKAFAKKAKKGGAKKIKYRYRYRWKKMK